MRTRAEANRHRWAILGFAVAVLLLSFVLLKSAYYQLVLTQVQLWAVLSLAWNLLCGYSGYFSFGHAVFWGLGAYTVALGMMYFDLTPWVSIPTPEICRSASSHFVVGPANPGKCRLPWASRLMNALGWSHLSSHPVKRITNDPGAI